MLPLTTRQFLHEAGLEGFEPSNTRIKNECLNLFGYNPRDSTYKIKLPSILISFILYYNILRATINSYPII